MEFTCSAYRTCSAHSLQALTHLHSNEQFRAQSSGVNQWNFQHGMSFQVRNSCENPVFTHVAHKQASGCTDYNARHRKPEFSLVSALSLSTHAPRLHSHCCTPLPHSHCPRGDAPINQRRRLLRACCAQTARPSSVNPARCPELTRIRGQGRAMTSTHQQVRGEEEGWRRGGETRFLQVITLPICRHKTRCNHGERHGCHAPINPLRSLSIGNVMWTDIRFSVSCTSGVNDPERARLGIVHMLHARS